LEYGSLVITSKQILILIYSFSSLFKNVENLSEGHGGGGAAEQRQHEPDYGAGPGIRGVGKCYG